MQVRILTEAECRECVTADAQTLQTIENAFTWLQQGRVTMPPIMHIEVSEYEGDVDIKSAYVQGCDRFAVKLASGFFNNPKLGLPSSSAMMVLFSAETGFCESVLLDNGYLTDLRTGLAGAVAAKYLANKIIDTVGVVGAGGQARYQIECLRLVRDFKRLLVHSRSTERAQRYADEMGSQFAIEVDIVPLEQLVRESDIVVTTTSSREPLIQSDWLHPGLHITAMGSDLCGKQELHASALGAADLIVCDRFDQCFSMGEMQHADNGLNRNASHIIELGELTSGAYTFQRKDTDITICDLTGTGVQDTAIALQAYDRAMARNFGTIVNN